MGTRGADTKQGRRTTRVGARSQPAFRAFVVEVAKLYLSDCGEAVKAAREAIVIERIAEVTQPLWPDQGKTLLQPFQAHWCAAYVVARHEKVVRQQLARRSLESFLPLYRSIRFWGNRRAEVEFPLFPGYLFLRICAAERLRALQVPGIVHIVSFQGMPVAIPNEQIESLRTALQLRKSEPHPYLAAGKKIRIKAGPLQGLEGVVARQNNQCRIIVSVDFIQRSTAVELWPEDLECILDTDHTSSKPPYRC